jgi:site-specific recombinase XerD
MTPIAPLITAFLQKRLAVERRASLHTTDSYAYAFQLLFGFSSRTFGIAPSELTLEQLDAKHIVAFLDHLQGERRNSDRTCNARLAAIKSFMAFVEHRVPSALEQVRQIRSIPVKRTDTRLVPHLDVDEQRALLAVPDPTTRLGVRDRAMIHLALSGGLRVSELVGIRLDEVDFNGRYLEVRVRGKGRRERILILWKSVADAIRSWLAVRGKATAPELFLNAWGRPMSRSGFEHVLDGYVVAAVKRCPSLRRKRVSPHVLRHSCAVNTLRATRDIRQVALWLGHATTQSTEVYLEADPTAKIEALGAMKAPKLRPGKFRPPDQLLAELRRSTLCGARAQEPDGSRASRASDRSGLRISRRSA